MKVQLNDINKGLTIMISKTKNELLGEISKSRSNQVEAFQNLKAEVG